MIKNQVAFVLGLQMDYAQPESIHFTIEDPKVDLIPSTPLLLVPMTNSQATLTENIEGKYEVFDHNEQLIFEGAFGPFKMAPKTKIHYPINWNNELFKPGKYRFVLNGSVSGETFRHISDFKIQTENVKEYHELTGFKKPIAEYFPWYIWLFFGLFGTGLLYAGLWLGKRKRSDS